MPHKQKRITPTKVYRKLNKQIYLPIHVFKITKTTQINQKSINYKLTDPQIKQTNKLKTPITTKQ